MRVILSAMMMMLVAACAERPLIGDPPSIVEGKQFHKVTSLKTHPHRLVESFNKNLSGCWTNHGGILDGYQLTRVNTGTSHSYMPQLDMVYWLTSKSTDEELGLRVRPSRWTKTTDVEIVSDPNNSNEPHRAATILKDDLEKWGTQPRTCDAERGQTTEKKGYGLPFTLGFSANPLFTESVVIKAVQCWLTHHDPNAGGENVKFLSETTIYSGLGKQHTFEFTNSFGVNELIFRGYTGVRYATVEFAIKDGMSLDLYKYVAAFTRVIERGKTISCNKPMSAEAKPAQPSGYTGSKSKR